jgi:hypothetical protein
MQVADALFEPILAAGYTTSRAFNAMFADRRWFMRLSHGRRAHHLHVVVADGSLWTERLAFRDALWPAPISRSATPTSSASSPRASGAIARRTRRRSRRSWRRCSLSAACS